MTPGRYARLGIVAAQTALNPISLGEKEPRKSPYRSGRWPDWIKSKNPDAPAVRLVAIPLSGRPPSQRYCHSGDTCGAGTALLSRASTACHFALVWVSVGHAAH
jgi:hypothetical protein